MKSMKLYPTANYEVSVYNDADLKNKQDAIDCAKTLWRDRCQEYMSKEGDAGTCVLGAGIYVYYLAPRCRRPSQHTIIDVSDVCGAQGSLVWEHSEKEVLTFLREQGLDVHYNPGNMD